MRTTIARRSLWFCGLVLLLAIGQAASAEDDKQPAQGNWFSRVFGGGKKETPKKKENAKPRSSDVKAETQSAGSKIILAKTTYFRRLEVCNKLREVAMQTGDEALMQRAEQLEVRVWDSYQDQLKRLSQNSQALSPEEQTLDAHLGAESRGSRGSSTPTGSSAIRTVPGTTRAERR